MQKKIRDLRNANIIHFIINSIIGVSHIIIYLKLFWLSKQSKDIYYYIIFIILFIGVVPIFLAIFITFKKLTKVILNVLKLILKYFILLEILLSVISSICLSENQKELSLFFLICPFNYQINDIDQIFGNYISKNDKTTKEKCKNRRCFFNELSKNNENYLCNFELKEKKQYCSEFLINDELISEKLINYYEFCENFVTFYKCQKPDKDYKFKTNKYDYKCPKKSDENINIILIYIFLFIDLIFLSSPWVIDITYIDELISSMSDAQNNIANNNQNDQSLKETNNTSVEQSDVVDEDNNFNKQPTEVIIIGKNETIINNIIKHKNKTERLNINQAKINSDYMKEKELNIKDIENNKSKSDILLMDNKNNNIFKLFNKNNIYEDEK